LCKIGFQTVGLPLDIGVIAFLNTDYILSRSRIENKENVNAEKALKFYTG
jgi:hypothetical protein